MPWEQQSAFQTILRSEVGMNAPKLAKGERFLGLAVSNEKPHYGNGDGHSTCVLNDCHLIDDSRVTNGAMKTDAIDQTEKGIELPGHLENSVFHSERYYEGDKVRQGTEQLA